MGDTIVFTGASEFTPHLVVGNRRHNEAMVGGFHAVDAFGHGRVF